MTARAVQDVPRDEVDYRWSQDMEAAVLGSILVMPGWMHELPAALAPEHFFLPANALVFEVMLDLDRRGVPPSVLLVVAEIERRGKTDLIQSPSYLTALVNLEQWPYHLKHYGTEVLRLARERRIAEAKERVAKCSSDSEHLLALLNELRDALADNQESEGFTSLEEGLRELKDDLERLASGVETGIRTGLIDLDRKMGRMQPGDVVVLAALTSAGKTSFVLNVTLNVIEDGHRVAVFSMEMNQKQVAKRLVGLKSGVPVTAISNADMTPEQWQRYGNAQGQLAALPLRLDAKHIPSVEEMRRQLLVEHRAAPFSLVVVDLLGSIRGGGENRTQEVSGITHGLKALAREMDVPIIACQQGNRQASERGRIQMSDIKDSSTVEQVASIVLLLTPPKQEGTVVEKSTALIEIAKNRDGEKGVVPLYFHWPTMKFGDLAREESQAPMRILMPAQSAVTTEEEVF